MPVPVTLNEVARVPELGDNAAIAIQRLEAGTTIRDGEQTYTLSHTVLEGHRFAVLPIPRGQPLLSWGLPFGLARTDIAPGDYVCNAQMLVALRGRHIDFALPPQANFDDHAIDYHLDEKNFRPGQQVPLYDKPGTFRGFPRPGGRRAGTRNFIVVMATTSSASSYVRTLAGRFRDVTSSYPNIDGVVAVAHTEGGGVRQPNNLDLVLRTLAGFMIHPNVGAVLVADTGHDPITNQMLRDYMSQNGYALETIPHHFLTLKGRLEEQLWDGEKLVRGWLEPINEVRRSSVPLRDLNIGLQCGGSDGFSGVSGNPLAGWIAKETVRHGGSANLAETPELIGAEPYILHNVRNLETAQKFLQALQRFQEWAGWHGHSAAGNPSGGNLYRGLYNIIVKSIGAARKKDPALRLDQVIAYGQPMTEPGYYFMDSPGNDLESVAGQVAAGCNLILFTTGNGSVTNFPFVPTIKVVTTTGRYNLLRNEMDINAGRYLDGTPMEALGEESFRQTVEIASGVRSAGEKAGHSQVQFWREWRQTSSNALAKIEARRRPTGQPLLSATSSSQVEALPGGASRFQAFLGPNGPASDQVALILPTSLCSGQVARLIADQLNRARLEGVSRFVALPHTEGCGVSRGESERLYLRTMAGYLCHPFVRCALLLEHGCEKTHNDEMQSFLQEQQIADDSFGWASVQLDGGIDSVSKKVVSWFEKALGADVQLRTTDVGLESLRLGLDADEQISLDLVESLATITIEIVRAGGTVVLPENSALLQKPSFCRRLGLQQPAPTISYGEHVRLRGLHIMETPTDHNGEIITGLGATGVEVILRHVAGRTLQAHPMIPMIQIGSAPNRDDLDMVIPEPEAIEAEAILRLILEVAGRRYRPKLFQLEQTDFQITRGLVGVSL